MERDKKGGERVTQKEAKEKEKISRTETGKFFYDLSKSTFTITVLGSLAVMFKDGAPTVSMLIGATIGIILSVVFFIVGYKILKK